MGDETLRPYTVVFTGMGMKQIHRCFVLLLAPLVVGACDDDLGGPGSWDAEIDTVSIYSLSRAELQGLPAAYSFVDNSLVVVEEAGVGGAWDLGLAEEDGEFVFIAPGAISGLSPSAGIARMDDATFEELEVAPADTLAYEEVDPVAVDVGVTYVVRSRRDPRVNALCVYHAKFETLATDADRGSVELRFTRNPFCNERALVPPDGD